MSPLVNGGVGGGQTVPPSSSGAGTVSNVTSTGGFIAVTNGTGPTVDLENNTAAAVQFSSVGVNTAAPGTPGDVAANRILLGFNNIHSASSVLVLADGGGGTQVSTLAFTAGLQDAGHAAVTNPTPTSGVAFTPNTTFVTSVVITANAAAIGTVSVTMGPTTGAENTICTAVALLASMGETISFICPNGWKVIATMTGAGATLASSVTVL